MGDIEQHHNPKAVYRTPYIKTCISYNLSQPIATGISEVKYFVLVFLLVVIAALSWRLQ